MTTTQSSEEAQMPWASEFANNLPSRVGITDESGKLVGTIETAKLYPPPDAPDSAYEEPLPVSDGDGELVGYYVPEKGFIELATWSSPSFDLESYPTNVTVVVDDTPQEGSVP